jgi:SAM-dependent methyltransferase
MTQTREALFARIRDTEARFPIPEWDTRRLPARRWVVEMLPKGGVGLEVGVFRGCFSALICEVVQPKKLYLVDPWTTLGDTFGWGKEYTNFDTLTTRAAREEAEARVALFPDVETVIIEGTYPACRDRIEEPLDFAYLDASHKFGATLAELRALARQVKPDALILGDDWHPDPEHQHHGVFRAVNEFCETDGWELIRAGPGAQWAIRRKA